MLSTALGATTAMWLLLAPVMEVQSGPRSAVGVAIGAAALVLAPLGIWRRSPRAALGALGLALGLVNFFLPGTIQSLADFATCATALIVAGLAPAPEATILVVPLSLTVPQKAAIDEDETPTRRLQQAA